MATVKPGIVGNFNGKIGEVVLSKWKDINVGKSTPRKTTKPPKRAQLHQRARFGLVAKFFGLIPNVISAGYQSGKANRTNMNVAVSYHLTHAITGAFPDYGLDYSKIMVSDPYPKSFIDSGIITTVVAGERTALTVSWINSDQDFGNTKSSDRAHLLFYSPVKHNFISYPGAAARADLAYSLRIPLAFSGDTLHGYLFFVSYDGKSVSYTDYLGQYIVVD
jgi:hypothetical protein